MFGKKMLLRGAKGLLTILVWDGKALEAAGDWLHGPRMGRQTAMTDETRLSCLMPWCTLRQGTRVYIPESPNSGRLVRKCASMQPNRVLYPVTIVLIDMRCLQIVPTPSWPTPS